MNDTALHPIADAYRAEVARVVADLPPAEAEEILDDVEGNLADVLSELGDGATEEAWRGRLGTPREYALELRTAAGYPVSATEDADRRNVATLRLAGLVILGASAFIGGLAMVADWSWWSIPCLVALAVGVANALLLRGGPAKADEVAELSLIHRPGTWTAAGPRGPVRAALDFVAGLKHAWLLLRAALTGLAAAVLLDSVPAGVVTGVLALVVSLWTAARIKRDRRWWWVAVPLDAFAAGALLGVLVSGPADTLGFEKRTEYVSATQGWMPEGDSANAEHGLVYTNGEPVRNLYPFDAQGRPLKDVYLFNEEGRPIRLPWTTEGGPVCGQLPPEDDWVLPGGGKAQQFPISEPLIVRGECLVSEEPPFTVTPPPSGQSADQSPVPSGSPSGSPSAGPSGSPSGSPTAPQASASGASEAETGPKD